MSDTLVPLQKAQGKVDSKGTQRKCPVHDIMGRVTDWKPAPGLDPRLREFQCRIRQHAFYEVIK